jgi:hypothetical protein
LLADRVVGAVVMLGCAIDVLLVLIRDRTVDALAMDVANGSAEVFPAVSREVITD